MATRYDNVRQEAVRLREEERLSLDEIVSRLGVPRGTCYNWIRKRPLPSRDRRSRRAASAARNLPRPRKDRGEQSILHAMSVGRDYSTLEAGAIAESATVLRLVINRWKVLNPIFDGDVVDLYVTKPGANRLVKIQVRKARGGEGYGLPRVSLRRMRNGRAVRFAPGDFDILVGYCLYNDTAYVWHFDEVADLMSSVTVCDEAAEAWDKLDAVLGEGV